MMRYVLKYFGFVFALFLLASSCTLSHSPDPEGGQLSLDVSIKSIFLGASASSTAAGSRLLLPETNAVQLSLIDLDSDTLVSTHTLTISRSIDGDQLSLNGRSVQLKVPVGVRLRIVAAIQDDDNQIIASAQNEFMLSGNATQQITLRLLPTDNHPALVAEYLTVDDSLEAVVIPPISSRIIRQELSGSRTYVRTSFSEISELTGLFFAVFNANGQGVAASPSRSGDEWILSYYAEAGLYYIVVFNNNDSEISLGPISAECVETGSLLVTVDLSDPNNMTVSFTDGIDTLSCSGSNGFQTMIITASGAEGDILWMLDGNADHPALSADGNIAMIDAASLEPGGAYTIVLVSEDTSGNVYSNNFNFQVVE